MMTKTIRIIAEIVLLALAIGRGERPPADIFTIDHAYLTTYNWHLGGHNTDGNPEIVSSGLPTSQDWLFDVGIACPKEWVGNVNLENASTVVITFPEWTGLGERWCIDTLGSVEHQKPIYRNGRWAVRLDLPARDPFSHPLNNETLTGWTAEWRPYWKLLRDHPIE